MSLPAAAIMRAAAPAALALALLPTVGTAQQMREFTSSRQRHGETRLLARIDYAAGSLRLAPGSPEHLYAISLSYDTERFRPMSRFDAASSSVQLGLETLDHSGIRVSSREQLEQSAMISLSPAVALGLDVSLGAAEAEIELGGLRLTSLRIGTGASRSTIRFSRPNRGRCSSAAFEAGAAEVTITGLGNSRCGRIGFKGGVGRAVLDLGGAWTTDASFDVAMTMGELTLRLPRTLGVQVTVERFLAGFAGAAWTRDGNTYRSPGYAEAERKVHIALSTTIGGVSVEWVD